MTEPRGPEGFVLDAEHPWPGLREFDEKAEVFFNGRERETAALGRLVREAALTVLFGRSGLGKTSLLLAGLFPNLRREHFLPVYVRINPRDRTEPLIEQARRALFQQLREHGVEHPDGAAGESLWEYLHREELEFWSGRNRLLSPLFVFDQFEELFTLGEENAAAVGRFREDLADLIENRMPGRLARELEKSSGNGPPLNVQSRRSKVLLSFREDFLPDVEGWRVDIPSLQGNRLRLLPLDGHQAFEAVFKTGHGLVAEEVAQAIVRFVAAAGLELEESSARGDAGDASARAGAGLIPLESMTIEPALLSLVCFGLNERRRAIQGARQIDLTLLEGTGLQIVTEFYEKSVAGLPARARRFIEDKLITENGYRNPFPREEALAQGIITEEELKQLVDCRLLRVESQMGADRIELIHDRLTRIVRASRDKERERRRLEELRKEQRQKEAHLQEELRQQRVKAAHQRKVLILISLIAALFVVMTIVINGANLKTSAANRRVQSLQLVFESRDILDGKRVGTDELGLQLAAAAYLKNGSVETLGALQYALHTTRHLAHTESRASEATCLAYSPDGSRIVAGELNGTLTLRDAATGRQVGEPMQGHESQVTGVAFSPDGSRIASAAHDSTIRVWDAKTGTPFGEPLKGHTEPATSVAFSPDGRLIASGSADTTVRLWDTQTGTPFGAPLTGHSLPVTCVAFSPDGRLLVSAGYDTTVRLWDVLTGKPNGEPLKGHILPVTSVAFSPNGERLASSSYDATVQRWDVIARKPRGEPLRGHGLGVTSVAFNHDGTRLASASRDKSVRLWDAETGESLGDPLRGHESEVTAVAFSPDGRRVASTSADRTVRVWDVESISRISAGGPVAAIASSPSGTWLAAGGYDMTVRLWDLGTGKPIGEPLRAHGGPVTSIGISPDGRSLASGSFDATVRLWDVRTGKPIGEPLHGHRGPVTSVAFSPDGKALASASHDTTVLIREVRTGMPVAEPVRGHEGPVTSVSFSPNGASLASASYDKTVRLWDARTGKPAGEPLRGHESEVTVVAFSPDGRWLASGSNDKTVRLWDAGTGRPVGEPLLGHTDSVTSVVFSPDSRRIVSGSADQSVRQWDCASGKPFGQPLLGHDGPVTSVAFCPDERWIASGSLDRTVRFWDGRQPSIERLCAKLTRNMSKKQWHTYLKDEPYLVLCRGLPVPEEAK